MRSLLVSLLLLGMILYVAYTENRIMEYESRMESMDNMVKYYQDKYFETLNELHDMYE